MTRMTRWLGLCMGILGCCSVVVAEDFVCEDAATLGKFRRYVPSVAAAQLGESPTEVCSLVSKADTPAQRAINVGNPHARPPVAPTVPVQYRKVDGDPARRLVVEMDAAEKAAVDAADNTANTVRSGWQTELTTPEACPFATIQELNAYFQGQVDELTPLIQAMPAGAARQAVTQLATTSMLNERRLAKIACARLRLGR